MHIRIANLRSITQEAIGYAHLDFQSSTTQTQKTLGYAQSDSQSKKS